MELVFKPVYFTKRAVDECYGLSVDIKRADGTTVTNFASFPSTVTPKEASKKLRELATWIDKETK